MFSQTTTVCLYVTKIKLHLLIKILRYAWVILDFADNLFFFCAGLRWIVFDVYLILTLKMKIRGKAATKTIR